MSLQNAEGSQPTPMTPGTSLKPNTSTPNQTSSSYRLLYRGALSLPDSHLLLDGLTFSARLDSPSKHTKSYSLLENPLALALESMRGRPSLRFMGVVKLGDIYLDEAGNVEMDIHPRATLSRLYFENTFCLKPFSQTLGKPLSSDYGVKVSLGDSDGPETTQIIIYAQVKTPPPFSMSPSSTNHAKEPPTIRLVVARLTTKPQPQKRLPRPDDPIPRKPPIAFTRDLQRAESKGSLVFALGAGKMGRVGELKRAASANFASSSNGITNVPKRPKLVGSTASMNDIFKVPELPMKSLKGKEKEKVQDVFGDVAEVHPNGKGKQKTSTNGQSADALEKANKADIKKATIAYLAQTKDPTQKGVFIDKKHPEFKELYNMTYRGICFAIRNRIKAETVDVGLVDQLLKIHVNMYLTGQGIPESSNVNGAPAAPLNGANLVVGPLTGSGTTENPIYIGK